MAQFGKFFGVFAKSVPIRYSRLLPTHLQGVANAQNRLDIITSYYGQFIRPFQDAEKKFLRKGHNLSTLISELTQEKEALLLGRSDIEHAHIEKRFQSAIESLKGGAAETTAESIAKKAVPLIGQTEVDAVRRWGPIGGIVLGAGIGIIATLAIHTGGLWQAWTENLNLPTWMGGSGDKTQSFAGAKAAATAATQAAIQTKIQDQAKNDANSSAIRQSERDRLNRVLNGPSSKADDDKVTTNIQYYSMPNELNDCLNNQHLNLPFTTDFLLLSQDFTNQPLQNAPAGDMKAITFQDGSRATIDVPGNALKGEKPTTYVVVQFADGTQGFVDAQKFDKADNAPAAGVNNAAPGPGASNAGPGSPLAYNQNGMTITQATDPNGPPPTVTVQHPGHKGDGLALAFGALAVGYVGGGALRGKPNAKSGNGGPKPKGPDVPHAANDHVLHVSPSEMKAGANIAKTAIKDAAKASKFVGIAKFLWRKAPIIGAFVAAGIALTVVKDKLDHRQYAQAGVESVNGFIDTLGGVEGGPGSFVADGIHEGIRSLAITLGGDQFRTLTKSGTREMAEGAVNVAGAIMAQRPGNAPGAPQPAGLHA